MNIVCRLSRVIGRTVFYQRPIVAYYRNFGDTVSSSSSHEDFRPKKKINDADMDEVLKFLKKLVKENKVMLFMKGTPSLPQCGFSYKVSEMLKDIGVDFASANILTSPKVAVALKKFSDWPTFPQLYINGEFVGGCDIVTELYEKGELKKMLIDAGVKVDNPNNENNKDKTSSK